MKNIIQKFFLFLSLCLFCWTYGQDCNNLPVTWTTNNFSSGLSVKSSQGAFGIEQFSNKANVIDNNTENASTWTSAVVNPTAHVEAQNNSNTYPKGTYAGVVLSETSALALSTTYRVETYLNDEETGDYIELSVPIAAVSSSKRNLGVISTKPFNKIRVKVDVSGIVTTNVYYFYTITPKSCIELDTLACNTNTPITQEKFAAVINYKDNKTGTNGLTLGKIENPQNIVNNDNLDYATMSLGASIGASAQVSVKDLGKVYEAGFFAGFDINNQDLLNANLLSGTKIITYLNGVKQEESDNNTLLVNLSLLGFADRAEVGIITTKPFDEVQFVQTNTLGLNLFGNTQIYSMVVKKMCKGPELACNEDTKIITPAFPAIIQNSRTGVEGLVSTSSVKNSANVVNSNADDYATINLVGLNEKATLSVATINRQFDAGYFAGFEISSTSLLNLNLFENISIKTYLNGVEQETSDSNSLLLNLKALGSSPKSVVGFVTTKPFDEVQLVLSTLVGVNIIGETRVYNMIVKKLCKGPIPVCNVDTKIVSPTYPAIIQQTNTGTGGLSIGSLSNSGNVVNSDTEDYASLNITASLAGTATLSVATTGQQFDAGNFAGFEISNTNLLNVNLLGGISIRTYLKGVEQETSTQSNLLLNLKALGGTPRSVVGFVTTKPFDEVQFRMSTLLSVDLLGETRIYNMIVKKYCEGPDLACNTNTLIGSDEYPYRISNNTGVTGIATLGSIVNTSNLLDNDPSTFASINIPVGVLSTATIAIQKQLTPLKAGTYVSFDVVFTNLVDVSVLPKLKLRLLRNGAQVGIEESGNFLLGANLVTDIRKTLGFKAPAEFDEIQLIYEQPVGVSLGTIKVYDLHIMNTCQNSIDCSTNNPIENTPTRPVVVNNFRTGIDGLVCVLCKVENPENIISPSETDYTTLTLGVGVAGRVGVSVLDLTNRYPTGTHVGFTIADVGGIIKADLLETFAIKTYLNGNLQETVSSTGLLDLSVLGIINVGIGQTNYGFKSTKPFNEVKIEISSLASVINTIKVYNVRINPSSATGNDGNLICSNNICVKSGDFSIGGTPSTAMAVSTQASQRPTWPADVPNGFIVLESKNKGLVISRVSNSSNVHQPQEGMLIYDTSASCIKLYNGIEWKCISKSCNTEPL
ncbi:hypothetical protein [Empedobacter brevis]|uniref:hypothetical protein n=1 Tax=Empedobacter brevis TaxID=247 RepID=UPI0039B01885